jgi:hypothetical protein
VRKTGCHPDGARFLRAGGLSHTLRDAVTTSMSGWHAPISMCNCCRVNPSSKLRHRQSYRLLPACDGRLQTRSHAACPSEMCLSGE